MKERGPKSKALVWLMLALLSVYSAFLLWDIFVHRESKQWDFQTYYYAAKAHASDLNPYALINLSEVAHKKIRLRFLYPPVTLWFFRLFALFDYTTAYILYFLFKCFLLLGLVFLWAKVFLSHERDWVFYFFLLFAFNSALYVDLVAGNISLLEQFFIWLAFFFFLKKRFSLFCLCLLGAALFKTTPIVFLALLFFLPGKKKYVYAAAALSVFGAANLIFYRTDSLFAAYLFYARRKGPGIFSHSTLGFFLDLFGYFKEKEVISVPQALPSLLFYATIAVVLGVTFFRLKRIRFGRKLEDPRILIFLVCVIYVLVLPRFKDYSYVLMIVPAYYVIKRFVSEGSVYPWILIFFLSTPIHVNLPGFNGFFTFFWNYYPLFLAFVVWILYLFLLSSTKFPSAEDALLKPQPRFPHSA